MSFQLAASRLPRSAPWLFAVLAAPALGLLFQRYEVPLVLAVLVGALVLATLVARPELATLATVLLLYTNTPGVAIASGAPRMATGAFMLLLVIPVIDYLLFRRERVRSDAVFVLMLCFLGVMLLASLGAKDRSIATGMVVSFLTEGLLLYWLLINTVRTMAMMRRVVWAVLGAGIFLGSLSIYQAVTRSYDQQFLGYAERKLEFEHKREQALLSGTLETRMYRADRAEGPQLGNNRYAQTMIVLLPLAFLRLRNERTRRLRLLAAAAGSIILVGGVLLTYSRGAMLATAAVACAAALVKWVRPRRLVMAGLALVVLLPLAAPTVTQRFLSIGAVADLDDPSTDGSIRGRATEMLAALHVFLDHPVLGVGPGQYKPFYSVEYQQLPGIGFRDVQESRRAHTLYIEMAAENGIIGLIFFLSIPLLLLRELWRAYRRWAEADPELSSTAAAYWLGIIGFAFTAMFLSHAFERYYWFLIAMSGATLHILAGEARSRAAAAGGTSETAVSRTHLSATTVAAW